MDPLGRHLKRTLKLRAQTLGYRSAIGECWSNLREQLREFKLERRLLIKLSDTGRVVVTVERALEAALEILHLQHSVVSVCWRNTFQRERDEWMELNEALVGNSLRMWYEMGGKRQSLEILTRMRHEIEQYNTALTYEELDLMATAFENVVRRSGEVVAALPTWFATSKFDWYEANLSLIDVDEESFIRNVELWADLHHPNVRKLYGASHVGKPFAIHESSFPISDWGLPWKRSLECARGLEYIHSRGLVYRHLSEVDLLQSNECRGILSGVGIISQKDSHYSTKLIHLIRKKRHASVPGDIQAFGLCIFELLTAWRNRPRSRTEALVRKAKNIILPHPSHEKLPASKPDYFLEPEWDLLTQMCAADPAERIEIEDIIYRMGLLSQHEEEEEDKLLSADEPSSGEELDEVVDDLSLFEIQTLGLTLSATLDEAEGFCDELPELLPVNGPVLARLKDIYTQLQACREHPPLSLVETYCFILVRFLNNLDRRLFGDGTSMASVCASRTVANKNYGVHHDIDRLLQSSPLLDKSAAIHYWKPVFQRSKEHLHKKLETCLEDPQFALSNSQNEVDSAQGPALLQFETLHSGALILAQTSNASNSEAGSVPRDVSDARLLPTWFIPSYQVELGKHIADGSFGATYEGKWLGADVVVKLVMTDQCNAHNREQFQHEVSMWFSLVDRHLIKLYGACHVGQPFFVCKKASLGTLTEYLKSKAPLHRAWVSLWEAALGLQHLHDRGIVHGDLKCNNILVCRMGDEVKLCNFGLSSLASELNTSLTTEELAGLGAIRWKAPECLLGAPQSFASDIYSFGMCIIEAVTGQYPWGTSMSDSIVRYKVTHQKLLPPRPSSFNDAQWDLVNRMCCFDPQHRIKIGAVVNYAYEMWMK